MTVEWVETADQLLPRTEAFLIARRVAVDLEGDGFFRYRARLCTLQIATEWTIALVDTLVCPVIPELARMLGPSGPEKVMHDCAFDARLFWDHGVDLRRVFDTSVAARFLGEPATGLAALVEKHLGVQLPKEHQLADWGRRPLDAEKMKYLADDVRYLLALAQLLREEISRRDIDAEVQVECNYVLRQAKRTDPDKRPLWSRVKGYDTLSDVGQSVLRELVIVREREAERQDVPPFKILRNEALLAVAKSCPRSARELKRLPGLSRGRARDLTGVMLDAVRGGVRKGKIPAEEIASLRGPRLPRPERARRQACHKRLSAWRKALADERQVHPQVVLPGHCLQDIVADPPPSLEKLSQIEGLGEVRVLRYGSKLIELAADPP